jgi:hypothetical protein
MCKKVFVRLIWPLILFVVGLVILRNCAAVGDPPLGFWDSIHAEFFGIYSYWGYTLFAYTTLLFALRYWFRKPGPVSLLITMFVAWVLCGPPGLHVKNTLLFGSWDGDFMREMRMFEERWAIRQGLPMYLNR